MFIFPLAIDLPFNKDLVAPITIVVAVIFLLIGTRLRRKQGDTVRQEALQKTLTMREHQMIRGDLEKLIVDLHDLSRQINAQIDTRFCKLEVLLKEADDKIRRLEALKSGVTSTVRQEETDPEKTLIYKLADAGKTPLEIAREVNKNIGEIELILSLRRSRQGGIDYRIGD